MSKNDIELPAFGETTVQGKLKAMVRIRRQHARGW